MPLTTNKELLTLARKGGYAVGAFNMNNLEILQAIVSAGEAERSPAIIAVSEGAIQYAGMPYLISMVPTAAAQTCIPISVAARPLNRQSNPK
jgi:fructose-bisphosphate aldolase class II